MAITFSLSESGNEKMPVRATCDECGMFYDRTSTVAAENIMNLHGHISHSPRTRKQESEFAAANATSWSVKRSH